MSKILPRFPQWISPRILLPVANLGEIPGKIALRFLPPWICSLARILGRFAVAFWRDFGHWDSCFSARILARFTAGSRRDFGRREFRFLARILPGSQRDSPREEKSQWSKSRRDPNRIPAEIAGGILPRSRSLLYKGYGSLSIVSPLLQEPDLFQASGTGDRLYPGRQVAFPFWKTTSLVTIAPPCSVSILRHAFPHLVKDWK